MPCSKLRRKALLVGASLAVMLALFSSMAAPSTPAGSVTEQPRTLHSQTGGAKVSSERQIGFTEGLTCVLDNNIKVTNTGVKRVFGLARPYVNSKRTKGIPEPLAKEQSLTSIESICDGTAFPAKKWDTGDPTCCLTRRCNEKFDFEEATALRCAVPKRGKGQQSVRKIYVQSRIMDAATGTGHRMFLGESLYMVEVCTSFFCMLTGLSRTLIASACNAGGPGMARRMLAGAKRDVITSWLTVLSRRWEQQPDSDEIHMSFPNKLYVFHKLCTEWGTISDGDPPTYPYFISIWNEHCKHIKLKKAMRFTLCDACVCALEALDHHRIHGGGSWMSDAMRAIKQGLEDHYEDVRKCRQIYMMAKALSRLNPLALLVIAIDGSDKSSYATPYFSQVTKDSCMGWRMRLKLIGALVSGRLLHFFTFGSNWESGSNLTIEVLHQTLVALSAGQDGVALPRVLHLQMDNCSRENKNRFFLGYLHLLVYFGVFDVIELHFGLKGHTHDEIDQVFSRIGVHLKPRNALTRSHLGELIKNSYKASFPVELTHLYNCANVRDLLAPCMFPIPHVTMPQAFRVSTDPTDGNVKMQVQHRGYEDKWGVINSQKEYGPGYMVIMKTWPNLADTPPCPRKVVEESTLHQHRLSCKAAEGRMMGILMSSATMTLDDVLDENEKSIQDLGESTPVNFAWDTQIYTANQEPEPEPEPDLFPGGAGGDDDDTGDGGASGGGGGGESEAAAGGLDWTVGRFAVFPMDASNSVPLLVGKIVEFRVGEEGKEAVLDWWSPVRKNVARSKYGKGVWSADFLANEPSAPERSTESVDAACMTFSKWNARFHLPTAVWDTVNDQVSPPEDEGEEEQDTEEDKRGAAALEPGITVPASEVRVGEQPAEPLALPTPPTLEPPRGMRVTAAFHRPRRNEG